MGQLLKADSLPGLFFQQHCCFRHQYILGEFPLLQPALSALQLEQLPQIHKKMILPEFGWQVILLARLTQISIG
ncbi:hypothetical protein D3C73_1351550 [compost metagenome]